MYTISRRESFSDTTFLWDVMAPDVAQSAEPGHFVMLRLHDERHGARLAVVVGHRQRDPFAALVQPQHHEVAGLGRPRDVGRHHIPEKGGVRKGLASGDCVHEMSR